MNDRDPMNAVLLVKLGRDFAHFGEGHGFVRFIIEIERGSVVGLIADEAMDGASRR